MIPLCLSDQFCFFTTDFLPLQPSGDPPGTNWPLPAPLYAQLLKAQAELLQQIGSLRKEVEEMQTSLQEARGEESTQLGRRERRKLKREKKIFKKDRSCPFEACSRKYSSNIALNAHIKKVHSVVQNDSSSYHC